MEKKENFNSYASEVVPIFYYHDKTRIQVSYFLNNIHLLKVRVSKISDKYFTFLFLLTDRK